jgi:uncharacterized protein (DUF4415 family)
MAKRIKSQMDIENPEWTKEDFARAVPMSGLPKGLQEVLTKAKRGPQKAPTKVPVSIRLSVDVVTALRATGEGWQTRVDDALRAWLERRASAAK